MNRTINHNSEVLETHPQTEWDQLATVPFNNNTKQETNTTEQPNIETTELQAIESTTKQPQEAYRPIDEMEKSEIAREYMDLLQSLSNNFTSPETVNSAVVDANGSIRSRRGYESHQDFIKKLYWRNGLELDEGDNSEELRQRYDGTNYWYEEELHFKNKDLDRALTLAAVDDILSGEQEWQDAGEDVGKAQSTLTSAVEKLNQLRAEHQSKGFFRRILSTSNFRQQVEEVHAMISKAQEDLSQAEKRSQNSNFILMRSLEAAYSPDYHYGHHRLSDEHKREQGYQERVNEEYNNRFFGASNPERQAQVNRALELRKALNIKRRASWR